MSNLLSSPDKLFELSFPDVKINDYYDQENLTKLFRSKLTELVNKNTVWYNFLKIGSPELILLKNIPKDINVVKSDDITERIRKKSKVSESFFDALSNVMNCSIVYNPDQEIEGKVANIIPKKIYQDQPSTNSMIPMWLHVDCPFRVRQPHFLSLIAQDEDLNCQTSFLHINELLKNFSESLLFQLKKSEYKIFSGSTFGHIENGIFPLIDIDEVTNEVTCRFIQETQWIEPQTEEARRALILLERKIKEKARKQYMSGLSLRTGQCLIMNNAWGLNKAGGVIHGRYGRVINPFRWTQRIFLVKNHKHYAGTNLV